MTTTTPTHPLYAHAATLTTRQLDDTRGQWTEWQRTNRGVTDPDDLDREWAIHVDIRQERAERSVGRWLGRVPTRYQDATIDTLDERQQPDVIGRWLDDPEALTLFLVGPAGTGKTYAAHATGAEYAARGDTSDPLTWSVPAMLDALRRQNDDTERLWDRIKDAPLLILDDLAAARPTDWSAERMWCLVDARVNAARRTVVTTNATWEALVQAWGEPTMDRLRDKSSTITIAGKSRRTPLW